MSSSPLANSTLPRRVCVRVCMFVFRFITLMQNVTSGVRKRQFSITVFVIYYNILFADDPHFGPYYFQCLNVQGIITRIMTF